MQCIRPKKFKQQIRFTINMFSHGIKLAKATKCAFVQCECRDNSSKIGNKREHCGDIRIPKTLCKENQTTTTHKKKHHGQQMNGNVSLSFTVFIWVLRAKFVRIMYSFVRSFARWLCVALVLSKQFIVCCVWLFATLRVRFVFRILCVRLTVLYKC